ncbi:MAG: hypothetical protein RLZ10_2370 [Bacteroidota bacterium]|jgi:hypothetical protein
MIWDITILKKVDEYFIVMNVNGDTHLINRDSLDIFLKCGRVSNAKEFGFDDKK